VSTPVHELELPEVDVLGLDRDEVLAAFDRARREHWLARTPLGYAVTRHPDVTAILRDRRFHSALSKLPQMIGIDSPVRDRQATSILAMEGAEHTRLRRLASPAFTPRATEKLRPFMRDVIEGLVDAVAPAGRCELVSDICEPYPIPIICELLGAPKSDWKQFSAWATDIFKMFNGDAVEQLPVIEQAMRELDVYVRAMIDERRSAPADDLLTRLITAEEEGDRMSTDELVMMVAAVLMAGTDTTRNQLACSVALLVQNPEQWAALAADPSLAPAAVEETMRRLGAVRATLRFAAEDAEYRDVLFPAGTLITAALAAGNHDPEIWADPLQVDITRPQAPVPQLTFGSGIHFCMGASLARAELQEALPVLARRMPDARLDGEIDWKPAIVAIWGPARLPLAFSPSA
jgi:cytochrome P450